MKMYRTAFTYHKEPPSIEEVEITKKMGGYLYLSDGKRIRRYSTSSYCYFDTEEEAIEYLAERQRQIVDKLTCELSSAKIRLDKITGEYVAPTYTCEPSQEELALRDALQYMECVCDDRYNSPISDERREEVISILSKLL